MPDPASGCEVPGDQRALIPFDFDRDGDPDQLITQVGLPTLLLENRTTGRHWLTVALDPTAARASGAWVTVRAGGHTQRHLVLASSSYLSGTPLEAYVGLGDAILADEVDGRVAGRADGDAPGRPGRSAPHDRAATLTAQPSATGSVRGPRMWMLGYQSTSSASGRSRGKRS